MYVAVDTGGTFTDIIFLEEDVLKARKVFSTPEDPSKAILEGLKGLPLHVLIHGTTVGTNAFLERKGAEVAFITTQGFKDIIFIGRQARPKLYDFFVEKPAPILKGKNTFEVKERVLADGKVLEPLREEEITRVKNWLKENPQIQSVAICLLHSYLYPEHEKKLKKVIKLMGIPVSISSEVLSEFREYERASTTVINAYLAPVMSFYLDNLKRKLKKINLYIQQSNGGWMTVEEAREFACHTVLSGPAGGVNGALLWGKTLGEKKLITFDMGGTSTDVCLIDEKIPFTREYMLDGYPLSIPVIDIHTVGAGGGSIAYIDKGGALKVGPQSAGANPGPACYGKKLNPTVTDANVVLGRILPERFLGGRYQLKKDLSEKAIYEKIAKPLGINLEEAALGIVKIANINMARAVSKVSLERGYDPQEFALFCFGGAGALHACSVAKELGIKKIIIPKIAGGFSAFGLLFSSPMKDFSQTVWIKAKDREKLNDFVNSLKAYASDYLAERNLNPSEFEIYLDMRYKGQGFELTVPMVKDYISLFEESHEKHFGYSLKDPEAIEVVTIRLRAKGEPLVKDFKIEKSFSFMPYFESRVYTEEGWIEVPVISWDSLSIGEKVEGPAIICEEFTTVWIEKEFICYVRDNFTLMLIQKENL